MIECFVKMLRMPEYFSSNITSGALGFVLDAGTRFLRVIVYTFARRLVTRAPHGIAFIGLARYGLIAISSLCIAEASLLFLRL
jgi:hypothetical protein